MSDFVAVRAALRSANDSANEGVSSLSPSKKLDSSLKKHTSFIKKIRLMNAESAPSLLAEIAALTLEKYLSEITASLAEGILRLSKNEDLNAAVNVSCALHQRFPGQFSPLLLAHMVNAALEKTGQPEQPLPTLRHKTAIKFAFEMQLLGMGSVFGDCAPEVLGEPAAKFYSKLPSGIVIVTLLKDLMSQRLEQGYALPGAVTFLRRFSAYLGSEPAENDGSLPESLYQILRQLFTVYTTRVLELRQEIHAKKLKLEIANKKASIRTGKIMAEHQSLLDEFVERGQHFETYVVVLCELLGMHLPALESVEEPEPEKEAKAEEKTWWEDSKEREFYTEVPNYKDVLESFDHKKLPQAEYGNLSEGQKVSLFTAQLEELIDGKDLEQLTVVMHTYIPYNKATRNRIIRFFTEAKKVDNVNLYARFIKMNADYFPEVIAELIEMLDRGFRSQIHFDTINFKNLAFFIELVKFKLIPSHVVFHKIRRMTLNIPGTGNVDILSVFYERCGKFLLYEPEYSETTKEMLDLLHAQAKSDKLSINEKLSLSNMFLIVDSFTGSAPPKKAPKVELTVMQDFVHQVVKKVVTPYNFQNALKLLLSVDIPKNSEAQETLIEIFSHPETIGGDRLRSLAELFLNVGKVCRRIPIVVVDILTDKIIRGLELNDYRQNAPRIAQVKMLAAFYNAKVLSFRSILDILFKIVCFGYPNNLPVSNSRLAIDPPDNYFRVHLVCTLVKGLNLRKESATGLLLSGVKTAEGFLVFFKYYIFCKVVPLPKDIEFSFSDALANFNSVSPRKMAKCESFTEAMQSLQQYTIRHRQTDEKNARKASSKAEAEDVELVNSNLETLDISDSEPEPDFESDSEMESDDSGSDTETSASDEEMEESSDNEGSDEDMSDTEDTEKEEVFQFRSTSDQKAAQKMDDEIKSLLNVSMHQHRSGMPLKMPAPSTFQATAYESNGPEKQFKFLTKSNNLRDLALPAGNKFAERIAVEQAAQKANRQKIMSLVNNMDTS